MDFLNKTLENWLKWISLPFAFLVDFSLYVFFASELNKLPSVEMKARECLLLAIPFVLLLLVYVACCWAHSAKLKKEQAGEEEAPEGKKKSAGSKKRITLIFVACLIVVTAATSVVLFVPKGDGPRSGDYVIWSEEYQVALSPEVHKSYYLAGDTVLSQDGKLVDYPKRCVVQLEFNKDGTFTIAHNGKLLGVAPGKNGVGYSEQNSSILWELVELEEGVYYIRNVDENAYLKWYDKPKNWTSHPDVIEEYELQYRLRLEYVK